MRFYVVGASCNGAVGTGSERVKRLLRRGPVAPALVVAVILTGAGVAYARRDSGAATFRTARAALGTVTQTIALSGNLSPVQEVGLDFGAGGRVLTVAVQTGADVAAGATLATLDPVSLRSAVDQAQATLDSASAKLALDQAGPTVQNLAQAQAQVDSAQVSLDNARVALSDSLLVNQQSIGQAQSAVVADQNTVNADQQVSNVDEATLQSDQSRALTDCAIPPPAPPAPACTQDQQAVQSQGQKVAADQQTLTRDQGALDAGGNALNAAQVRAQQSADQARGQVASSQVALSNAGSAIAALRQGTTAQQLQIDESQVTIAQLSVDAATRSLSQATLVAPAAGVIGQVNISVGQSVSGSGASASGGAASSSSASSSTGSSGGSSSGGGSAAGAASSSAPAHAITIISPGAFQVTGNVSDAQVTQIAVGQRARVTPAGWSEAADGRVTGVAAEATVTGGVATFPVTITIDGTSGSLRSGSSASVALIVNQTVHVLTVPTSAVAVSGSGATVQVMVDGQPHAQSIQIGASDPLRTQVVSGLNDGDTVVIARISSSVPTTSSGGGFLGGGRPGGGGRGAGGAAAGGGG